MLSVVGVREKKMKTLVKKGGDVKKYYYNFDVLCAYVLLPKSMVSNTIYQ